MAWRVRLENTVLGTSELLPGIRPTEQRGFDKAKDDCLKWLRDSWQWDSPNPQPAIPLGGDASGPAPGRKFKILYDTRIPGKHFINVRWDYQTGPAEQETNDAYWRVIEV